jgi:hypothetical protein
MDAAIGRKPMRQRRAERQQLGPAQHPIGGAIAAVLLLIASALVWHLVL